MIAEKTQKIIDDGDLDKIGFESNESRIDHLELWMEQIRPRQDDLTLSGLIVKVKEISGLMPVLKQVVA